MSFSFRIQVQANHPEDRTSRTRVLGGKGVTPSKTQPTFAIWTVICCSVRKSREKLREETSREGKIREVEVKGKVEVEADL